LNTEGTKPASEFLWGVATSAYQSEGGYNGKNQPQTNWTASEVLGTVMRTGRAAEFWTRYPEDFDNCRRIGLNAFRMSVEWSRIQPTTVNYKSSAPAFDLAALEHYAEMLMACRERGMEPLLTLHHFTHPAWLGMDAWLNPGTPDLFTSYVRETVRHLNTRLTQQKQSPVRYYITINEPNTLLLGTYLLHQFPSHSLGGLHKFMKAAGHLLAAHVKAYHAIHAVYEENGWNPPQVTLNNFCTDLYWSDKVFIDLLAYRERGISPGNISQYISSKADTFEAQIRAAQLPLRKGLPQKIGEILRRILLRRGARHFNARYFDPFLRAMEESPHTRVLDFIAFDYYDPFTAHILRMPRFHDIEFRDKSFRSRVMNSITSKWWDWHVLPEGLHFFCKMLSDDFEKRPLLIAENGMALHRKKNNKYSPRRDKIQRSDFLRAHIREVIRIVNDGIPLFGYFHWSLFDNYEWGTYTPRFGLYSIDYKQGTDRLIEDHTGDRPSETYAQLITEARGKMPG